MSSFSPKPSPSAKAISNFDSPRVPPRFNSQKPRNRLTRGSFAGNFGNAGFSGGSSGVDVVTSSIENNTHYASFNAASSQYLSITDANQTGLDLSTAFTISFWFQVFGTPSTGNRMAFIQKWEVGQQAYFLSFQNQSGVLTFEAAAHDGTNLDKITWPFKASGAGIGLNHWYHYACTFDASEATATEFELYINGMSQGNGDIDTDNNISTIANRTSAFGIGANGAGTVNFLTGAMDEVKVYNTVRTGAQILADMRQNTSDISGLQAYWTLNNVLTDSTTNANTLTNNNSVTFATATQFSIYGNTTRVIADSGGDGMLSHVGTNANDWDDGHDATSSTDTDSTSALGTIGLERGITPTFKWTFRRGFVPFDTSTVTDDILEGFLYLDITASQNNSGEGEFAVVLSSQATGTELLATDYDSMGTTDGITRLSMTPGTASTRITVTQTYFLLNSTALTWINKSGFTKLALAHGHDIDDDSTVDIGSLEEDIVTFRTANASGTTNDPFIDIIT